MLSFAAAKVHLQPMRLQPLFVAGALAMLAWTAAPGPAPAQAQTGALELAGAERAQALARANAAMNRLRQVEGRFEQTAPDGAESRGQFYLQKPGRVRFAYAPPNPLTIVSDGATVAVEDRELRSVDRTPLRATPLYFVLQDSVDLERDARVTRMVQDGDQLLVTLRDRKGEAEGALTLVFAGGRELELRGWRMRDAAGQTTLVSLADLRPSAQLDPRLFRLEEAKDSTARRNGR